MPSMMELEEMISSRFYVISNNNAENYRGHYAQSVGVHSLAVYPALQPSMPTPSAEANKGVSIIQHLSPKSWLFSRHSRQLVNEAMGTFRSLQGMVEDATPREGDDPLDLTSALINKSREYRSMLQACVCSLNSDLDKLEPDSDEYQEMAGQCQLLYKMELLLGLVEIIFVDSRPGSLILSQLVCWVRLHYPACTEQMVKIMAEEDPSQHNLYWQTIYELVCQGRMSDARQMLQQHPYCHTDAFVAIEEILRKMPTYQLYSGVSDGEFMLRWQHWQAECENRLQGGEFAAWSHLKKLAEIMCGNSASILSVTMCGEGNRNDRGGCWVPHLLATLLFTQPNVKLHRLHDAATRAITECCVKLSALDALLLSAMQGDALQVVRGCQQTLDNLWLGAHLTDLLHHALASQRHTQLSLAAMRESIVQDYALELAGHPSLWQVGIVYLDYCGTEGVKDASPLTSLLLERVPLTSDAKAHKVINMAEQRNLEHVVRGVCRVMGRRAANEGRLAAAIWWAVRAKDAPFTSHTAHQVLHRYLTSGEFQSSALLLDHLGPTMLLSETLTFLGKYREFHSLYNRGDRKQAADLLVTLISSKLAPQYFWPVLLLDVLPLLQSSEDSQDKDDEIVVTAAHTYELMYCLNSVVDKFQRDNSRDRGSAVAMECGLVRAFTQREHELRTCLAHNLARAIVTESSSHSVTAMSGISAA
ncbi:nuclear pore complex protein Nup85 isoform X1 [Hyalella azteca]|uniref:Nuclear pore complex protein Nup85 n=1 Tax=Hyalella azteca TaxID=294128 RepID=A0A8B7PGM4_HYAAZ|nr:nuclear pore complex protein Nup85 isoform X2 [Hyalella azteca]XP_018025150.1 nuclear pore complex protein Nup85 isoform X1 [Hyalella azteca]